MALLRSSLYIIEMSSTNIEHESFMSSLIVFIKGSLIFVVSQAWNSAIQHAIENSTIFNGDTFKNYGKIFYALTITFAAVYVLKLISNIKKIIENCRNSLSEKCRRWNRWWEF
jgi:hypothetical protein